MRHNPSYTVGTVPPSEHGLVGTLAQAEALRVLATDASKRRGLDADAETLLRLSESLERAYKDDRARVAKALVPIRSDDDGIATGDVVVGSFSIRSLRSGVSAHSSANVRPDPVKMYGIEPSDIFDFGVHIRWRRPSNSKVHGLELWRDTSPNVKRSRDKDVYPTTSSLVWSSRQSTNNPTVTTAKTERESWGTVGEAGALVVGVFDGFSLPPVGVAIPADPRALDPGQLYYWRMYVVDRNGEYAVSDVISATTKAARALFSRDSAIPALSVKTGPFAGGTAITVKGSGFTLSAPIVSIGGKACASIVIVDDNTITCVSPATHAWVSKTQDVYLDSVQGLRDIYPSAWIYT